MLPVAVIMFAESLMPIAKIEAVLQRVPIKVDNPYMALLYAYALTFFPMGIRLIVGLTSHDNVSPRKSVEQLCATNKLAASIFINMLASNISSKRSCSPPPRRENGC